MKNTDAQMRDPLTAFSMGFIAFRGLKSATEADNATGTLGSGQNTLPYLHTV
jgi:hypothetical protein